jgi:hypothetical protein
MKWTQKGLYCWICVASLCGLGGCGSEAPLPTLTTVHGSVTYLERPLPSGSIVFIPDMQRGNSGQLVHADIQLDGSYVLQTDERQGAAPGKYRVTVRALGNYPGRPTQVYLLAPERYSDPQLSGLACEVKQGQDNIINFHLR